MTLPARPTKKLAAKVSLESAMCCSWQLAEQEEHPLLINFTMTIRLFININKALSTLGSYGVGI